MATLASERYIAGPQYEQIDWELGKAFDTHKRNFATAWLLPQILNQVEGGHWGDPEGISGVAVTNSYSNHDVNYAQFGGEQDEYTYNMRGGRSPYTAYYSQSHVGLTWTSEQIEYNANAEIRRAEIVADEEAMAMSEILERLDHMLVGVNGLGTGNWIAAHNTPDIWGICPTLLNTNPYYSVNPRPPELNAVNSGTVTVAANGWFPEIARVQDLVVANHEPMPWLMIAPLSTRNYFVSESINPWRNVNRAVNMNLNSWDQGFDFDSINFSLWGTDLFVIFDADMEGSGPGSADNTFALLNPSKMQFYTMPNRWLRPPKYMQGGENQPNTWFGNIDMWGLLHIGSPKSHAYMHTYTLPAIS